MDMSKYFGGKFLKVEDIKAAGGLVKVRIVDVTEGRFDRPDLHFDDGSQMGVNATNGRVLARAYGFNSDDWIDKEVELYVGQVQFQGNLQDAILIKTISPPIENKAPAKTGPRGGLDDEIPF
ncbi:MAG: hypothetical protein C5B60_08485 [Chloroflexi bacterium]|nr:MAG: hypothetical protein C5B60_08485 [Chloroflexota bacterium]